MPAILSSAKIKTLPKARWGSHLQTFHHADMAARVRCHPTDKTLQLGSTGTRPQDKTKSSEGWISL